MPKIKQPELSCIQCKETKECAFGYDKESATRCEGTVHLGDVESCYTHHSKGTGEVADVTNRGCTLNRKSNLTMIEDENTETCLESGCNRINLQYSHCVSCESPLGGNCTTISEPKRNSKECKGIYTFSKRGCFTFINSK